MKTMKQCQSCGIPIDKKTSPGTNQDGSFSTKYCQYCYQNGHWTVELPFEEMYQYNLKKFQESDMSKVQKFFLKKMYTKEFMGKLERWKNQKNCF